jgi:hypothetical protein
MLAVTSAQGDKVTSAQSDKVARCLVTFAARANGHAAEGEP